MHCSIYGARFHIYLSWCDAEYGRVGHVPIFVAGLATLEQGPKTEHLLLARLGITRWLILQGLP